MTTKQAKEAASIYQAIPKIMSELKAVGKDSRNKQQGWSFRGIDAAYNALNPLMAKYGVFCVPRVVEERDLGERKTKTGGVMVHKIIVMEYDFFGPDGVSLTAKVVGEAMDTGDKVSNKCMSIAHKYALFQTFCIPTEEVKYIEHSDPDSEAYEIKAPQRPRFDWDTLKSVTYDNNNQAHKSALLELLKLHDIDPAKYGKECVEAIKGFPIREGFEGYARDVHLTDSKWPGAGS